MILEAWKQDILREEIRSMDELIAWLDAGNWLAEARREMEMLPSVIEAEARLDIRCRISQMANTLHGNSGSARDRERRLYEEARPEHVRRAAMERRSRAQQRLCST